jgi:hypothetical protein
MEPMTDQAGEPIASFRRLLCRPTPVMSGRTIACRQTSKSWACDMRGVGSCALSVTRMTMRGIAEYCYRRFARRTFDWCPE